MRKGIILDMNKRFLTLLTPDGEFLQIRRKREDYVIGQEVVIPLKESPMELLLSFFHSVKGISVAAAAIASILAIITFIPNNQNEVYAYMSIDINPSVELAVNEDLEVIKLIPYNESAKQVIEKLPDWKMRDIKEVTNELLEIMKKNGFINNDENIVISTVHTGKLIKKSDRHIEKVIDDMKKQIAEEEAKIISVEATIKDREKAIEKGVTTGKLKTEKQNKQKQEKRTEKIKKTKQPQKQVQKPSQPAVTDNSHKNEKNPNQKKPFVQDKKDYDKQWNKREHNKYDDKRKKWNSEHRNIEKKHQKERDHNENLNSNRKEHREKDWNYNRHQFDKKSRDGNDEKVRH